MLYITSIEPMPMRMNALSLSLSLFLSQKIVLPLHTHSTERHRAKNSHKDYATGIIASLIAMLCDILAISFSLYYVCTCFSSISISLALRIPSETCAKLLS